MLQHEVTVLIFVLIGVVGSLIGKSINARLNQRVLKQAFAVFLILIGGFVIIREGGKLVSPVSAESTATQTTMTAGDSPVVLTRQGE